MHSSMRQSKSPGGISMKNNLLYIAARDMAEEFDSRYGSKSIGIGCNIAKSDSVKDVVVEAVSR